MKAQDLRIGNIIKTPAGISVITGMSTSERGDSVRFRKVGETEQYNVGYYLEFCEPIEINHYALLLLGFTETPMGDHILPESGFAIFYSKELEASIANEIMLPHIKYVHQLQNIFFDFTEKSLNIRDEFWPWCIPSGRLVETGTIKSIGNSLFSLEDGLIESLDGESVSFKVNLSKEEMESVMGGTYKKN